MLNFLLGKYLNYLPSFFYLLIFISAAALFLFRKKTVNTTSTASSDKSEDAGEENEEKFSKLKKSFGWLAFAVILFEILYALFLTFLQYKAWQGSSLTRIFIHSPIGQEVPLFGLFKAFNFLRKVKSGYFIYFSFYRFWLTPLLSILASTLFYGFLRLLLLYRSSLLYSYEATLAFLLALLTGWPNFFTFIFLFLILFLLVSIYVFIRGRKTSNIAPALFLACILVIIFGGYFASKLLVLKA